jgi:hypothetical protein
VTKISQKPAVVLEEDPQHPGDGEDNLAVGNIQKKLFSHPLAPLLKPLGVAGGTKSSGATGKHHEALLPTFRTADAGKSAAGVAAVEIALDDLLDDRPEETVWLLKATLVLDEESVEIVKEHPVEDGALGMPRTIHARHGGKMASRNGPSPRSWPDAPEKTGKAPVWQAKSGRESVNRGCRPVEGIVT